MRRLTRDDTAFCDRLLGEVSRTFALSIRELPPELRDAIRAAYLLCRIVDTVEDDRALAASVRTRLFDAFDHALRATSAGNPGPAFDFALRANEHGLGTGAERELAIGAETVFRAFGTLSSSQRGVILPRVLEMSAGMREYAARADANGGLRIFDVQDLERYCHFVAGTVGQFLTDLFALACPVDGFVRSELDARASRFGIGLQLVNVLKDVAEDLERGDCFLPLASAEDHAVDVERLLDPAGRPSGLSLCRHICLLAREHLRAAEEYTLLWPHTGFGRDARAFCAGPLALALGTLRRIEIGTETLVADKSPAVSRDFVIGVFADLARAVEPVDRTESDARLQALFDRARIGVAGRPSRPPAPFVAQSPRKPGVRETSASLGPG